MEGWYGRVCSDHNPVEEHIDARRALSRDPEFTLVGAWFMALASASYPAPQAAKLSSPLGADCSNLAAASMEHGI